MLDPYAHHERGSFQVAPRHHGRLDIKGKQIRALRFSADIARPDVRGKLHMKHRSAPFALEDCLAAAGDFSGDLYLPLVPGVVAVDVENLSGLATLTVEAWVENLAPNLQ